jgi:hypothetical protein
MRELLLKLIDRLQQRLYNQKDDPRDCEWIKKELDKHFEVKEMNDPVLDIKTIIERKIAEGGKDNHILVPASQYDWFVSTAKKYNINAKFDAIEAKWKTDEK